jgi:hypothetical protein
MNDEEYKPYTINELIQAIYEDNLSHFEFIESMNGGDCDCFLHKTITLIVSYQEGYVPVPGDLQDAGIEE